MLRKAPLILMALALVLAGAAAWGAHRWIKDQAAAAAASKVVLSPVVVAAADLTAGQKLEAGQLQVQRWPAGSLPPGHLARPEQALGRVLMGPLVKGEVLLMAKLGR